MAWDRRYNTAHPLTQQKLGTASSGKDRCQCGIPNRAGDTPRVLQRLQLLPDEFPHLTAGDFALREILPTDAPDWHRYLSDKRVYEYTSAPVMSIRAIEGLIGMFSDGFQDKIQIRWALTEPASGTMIGDLGFNAFNARDCRAEVGYGLDPHYWRRGVMTAALSAIIDYGFSHLELNKIEATVNVGNEMSSGLL